MWVSVFGRISNIQWCFILRTNACMLYFILEKVSEQLNFLAKNIFLDFLHATLNWRKTALVFAWQGQSLQNIFHTSWSLKSGWDWSMPQRFFATENQRIKKEPQDSSFCVSACLNWQNLAETDLSTLEGKKMRAPASIHRSQLSCLGAFIF